jgi:hypothetical protein
MRKKLYAAFFMFICFTSPLTACPMCQGGEGFSQNSITAYKITTALLALLPIVMGLVIFIWVREKFRRAE